MLAMSEVSFQRLGGPAAFRRGAALVAMLIILVSFRQLALLGVAFVVFSRSIGWVGKKLARYAGGDERRGVVFFFVALLLLAALGVFASVRAGNNLYLRVLENKDLLTRFQAMQQDLVNRVPDWIPIEDLKDKAPGLLQPAIVYVSATGRILIEALIGLILAAVYLLDRGSVDRLLASPAEESFLGKLRCYFGYLGEAINITIQLQLLVALVNTMLTVPLLLALRLPHVIAFTSVIFFSSLVPVVGNLVSGAVLITASYIYRGVLGAVAFVIITFVLHKIEAYYLNPRLTSRHVHLPALVLIVSLIAFEHVFGIVGLFLSFPALYVGIKVAHDFRTVDNVPIAMPEEKGSQG